MQNTKFRFTVSNIRGIPKSIISRFQKLVLVFFITCPISRLKTNKILSKAKNFMLSAKEVETENDDRKE